ncbi:MAG: tRNA adenosine(34) deaminase TadA, partial [Thermomonas sp.]
FELLTDPRHNHRIDVTGGVLGEHAGAMLTAYFRARRGKQQT